jgi:hypothetical protein
MSLRRVVSRQQALWLWLWLCLRWTACSLLILASALDVMGGRSLPTTLEQLMCVRCCKPDDNAVRMLMLLSL